MAYDALVLHQDREKSTKPRIFFLQISPSVHLLGILGFIIRRKKCKVSFRREIGFKKVFFVLSHTYAFWECVCVCDKLIIIMIILLLFIFQRGIHSGLFFFFLKTELSIAPPHNLCLPLQTGDDGNGGCRKAAYFSLDKKLAFSHKNDIILAEQQGGTQAYTFFFIKHTDKTSYSSLNTCRE